MEVTDIDDDDTHGDENEELTPYLHDNNIEVVDEENLELITEEEVDDVDTSDDSTSNVHDDTEIGTQSDINPTGLRISTLSNVGGGVDRFLMHFKVKKYWSFMMNRALIKNGMKEVKLRSAKARSYLMSKTVQHKRGRLYENCNQITLYATDVGK